MRILYIARNFAPAPAGSHISAFHLVRSLAERGNEVHVLASETRRAGIETGLPQVPRLQYSYTGAKSIDLSAEEAGQLDQSVSARIATFRPDVVLIGISVWIERLKPLLTQAGIPSVWLARTMDQPDLGVTHDFPTSVVANSDACARYLETTYGRNDGVLYPLIDAKDFVGAVSDHTASPYITMVNPVPIKGGALFRSIAESMPQLKFRAIRGWRPDAPDGNRAPYSDLTGLENVTVDGPFEDMRSVYDSTRLLLVPSVWLEAFGRVALEAMMNGIPVVASNSGGLADLVDGAGTVVSGGLREWLEAIEEILEPAAYRKAVLAGLGRAREFDAEALVDRFETRILNPLIVSHSK
ncbi:glycosyltransferase family 4 protein [Promicromonospora sp. MS192]|uniref:glycosyltransferase family 4 protein n=1 Tax=Promicromonospora sp. MS192 TaxID=3412684 RepID=UPI003C2E5FEB